MKKRLIHDWPNVLTQNDELSSKILDLANDYSEEIKNKEHETPSSNNHNDINNNNDFELKQTSQGNSNSNFI